MQKRFEADGSDAMKKHRLGGFWQCFAGALAGTGAALAIFGFLSAQGPAVSAGDMIVRSLTMVDSEGVVRAKLGVQKDADGGRSVLQLLSEDGQPRVSIASQGSGGEIIVVDDAGKTVLALYALVSKLSGPSLLLYGEAGLPAVQLRSSPRGAGEILCLDLVDPENFGGETVRFPPLD